MSSPSKPIRFDLPQADAVELAIYDYASYL
jgi:hypothetical protein